MTTPKKTPAKKPKHVSKTKQELRRLREFAEQFTYPDCDGLEGKGGAIINGPAFAMLREEAQYALTGKKSEAMKYHDQLAAEIKRLNANGGKAFRELLAGDPGDESFFGIDRNVSEQSLLADALADGPSVREAIEAATAADHAFARTRG